MRSLVSLLCGLLFGLGLIISGMVNPAKVIGFLDLVGAWDPSLALVMVGAIAVAFVGFRFANRQASAVLGGEMHLPMRRDVDKRLVLGSLLFGVGWGIAGLCPGPALVSLGAGHIEAVYFVLAMVLGMSLFAFLESAARYRTS
jgi:uncharacterized membrane protein YedE/YeeE